MVHRLLTLAGLLFLLPLPAQAPAHPGAAQPSADKEEIATMQAGASRLMGFASSALGNKVATRAKLAYDRILRDYDANHPGARAALGFKKVGDQWQETGKKAEWKDTGNDEQRFKVTMEWVRCCKDLARIHRTRGLKLVEGDPSRAVFHLKRAVAYDPFDKEAHDKLGHEEYSWGKGPTERFYGTQDEIAFLKRLREIEGTALMLAKKDYPIEAVAQIPPELSKTGLEFHGAKSDTFTIFTRGTQENADNCVKWAERGLEFLEWSLGEQAKNHRLRANIKAGTGWLGFVWTPLEKEAFLNANPEFTATERGQKQAEHFANIYWHKNGKSYEVKMKLTPAAMHDDLVGSLFRNSLGIDERFAEGLMHASTWYMQSTTETRYGALPTGTAAEKQFELPKSTNWWLRAIRDQATAGTDFPVSRLPRVEMAAFDNDARIKSWNFCTWLLARYPTKWLLFLRGIPKKQVILNEDVDEASKKHLGRPILEVEAEWREWASGESPISAATGYGPPLLPEKPNAEQIEGMKRLDAIRKICGLPDVDLDLEATVACQEHARFLGLHPEHLKWPEAHEEDPAKEGFTPRGMRAGLRSVIVWGNPTGPDPSDSVDAWIGTVWHRFPLLEYNIRRIGFAYEGNVCVLDMGSLEEPRDPEMEKRNALTMFPFPGMKDVPTVFSFEELPSPLDDQPESERDQRRIGYPVSLQFSFSVAQNLNTANMSLYELGKGVKLTEVKLAEGEATEKALQANAGPIARDGKLVPCYEHTPKVPLLKRMELKDVVFVIPKEHLKENTRYGVVVDVQLKAGATKLGWDFTTGSREHGLGSR